MRVETRLLNKKEIQSLVTDVFTMQSADLQFNLNSTYTFEVEFVVRDDYLELKRGDVLIHKGSNDGKLDTRSGS